LVQYLQQAIQNSNLDRNQHAQLRQSLPSEVQND
jgi:hypothetical protein